jgi:hypothetical protein
MTPAIDLATLSVADLRRLLDRAEARGQVALAEQIRLTLAARAQGDLTARPRRARDDNTPEPSPAPDLPGPEAEPDDDAWVLSISTERRKARRARRRTVSRLVVGAAGLAAAAVAWALSGIAPPWRPKPPAPAPRAMQAYVAAPPPVLNLPPPAAEPTPQLPPRLAPADIQPATPEPPAAPAEKLAPRQQVAANPCSQLPTPAERMVCASPGLRAQRRQLQEAYVRALNSRADPQALDAGQAAFRLALARAEDPERLAELYDRRIRDLNAAAAEARLQPKPY